MPPLSSDEIQRASLHTVDEVLAGKSVTESVAGTIAQLLARDAFFGEAVMASVPHKAVEHSQPCQGMSYCN